ncbi:MAG: hypothetical protein ACRCWR_01905 [Saezia sp.]
MAFSKKYLRKIVCNERIFYWCVREDDDYGNHYLVIRSDEGLFLVSYRLGQKAMEGFCPPQNPFIIVKGREFKGLADLGGCWERFLTPLDWEEQVMTPRTVAKIIEWCMTEEPCTPVNYLGQIMPVRKMWRLE